MTDTTYVQRLQAWGTYGYRFAYTQAAQIVGHLVIGLLAPFKLKFSKNKKNNSLVHENLKNESVWYKATYRYTQILHKANQEFLMRPFANLAGIVGGGIGSVLGVFLSVIPLPPPTKDEVTRQNKFFGQITINKESQKFFGVLVWAGILGAVVGAFYPAPVVIFGKYFQGSSGLSQLFSATATFLYQLPTLIKNTWDLIKKIGVGIKDSVIWLLKALDKTITFVLKNTWYYAKKLGNFVNDSIALGVNQLKNICKTGWAHLVSFKNWVAAQFNYVYSKIAKVVNVIRENGLRGLLAWVKDKTIGSALRYIENLSQVSRVKSEIRELVDNLLDNENKKALLFKLFDDGRIEFLTLDFASLPKSNQLNLIMSHINAIAEGHRTNYQKGNVEVKLTYLENLKIMLKKLTFEIISDYKKETLLDDLDKVLNIDYRSWETKPIVDLDRPNPVMFNQFEVDSHIETAASNDGVNLENNSAQFKRQTKAKK